MDRTISLRKHGQGNSNHKDASSVRSRSSSSVSYLSALIPFGDPVLSSSINLSVISDLAGNKSEVKDDTSEGNEYSTIKTAWKKWKATLEPWPSWFHLFFCAVPINILIGIEYFSVGLYYVEYVEYFEEPISIVSLIYTTRCITFCLIGVFVGSLIRRYPSRNICVTGGLIYMCSQVIGSFAPNIYLLYVTQGVLIGISDTMCFVTNSVMIQKHFNQNRVLGAGISCLGFSIGMIISPLLVNQLIEKYNWRWTMRIMAAIFGHMVVGGLLMKEPQTSKTITEENVNEQEGMVYVENSDNKTSNDCTSIVNNNYVGNVPHDNKVILSSCEDVKYNTTTYNQQNALDDSETDEDIPTTTNFLKDLIDCQPLHNVIFVVYAICTSITRYNLATITQHFPNKVVTSGFPREEAAYMISYLSLASLVGRCVISVLANLPGMNVMLLYGCGVGAGGVGSLMTLKHTIPGFTGAAVLHGLHIAMTTTLEDVVTVQLLGLDILPKAMVILRVISVFGSLCAGPIGGVIYSTTDNYDIPFIVSGSAALAASCTVIVVAIRRQCKRVKNDRGSIISMKVQDEYA